MSKLVASGAALPEVYLSFQEYFEKPGHDPKRWGKPASALLGAFAAQMGLGIGAVGGKDSMSGSFEQLNVPPTLISFAVTTAKIQHILSNEFKGTGHRVFLLTPEYDADPICQHLLPFWQPLPLVTRLMREGRVLSCSTPVHGSVLPGRCSRWRLATGLGSPMQMI